MSKKKQSDQSLTWKGMWYDLLFKNVMDLCNDLRPVVGFMPAAWGFLIKHFIPPLIVILFALGADEDIIITEDDGEVKVVKKFGHYEAYPNRPYQVLGILVVCFAGFLFLSSLFFPDMYAALQPEPPESTRKMASSSVHAEPETAAKEVEKEDAEATPGDEPVEKDVEAPPEQAVDAAPEEIIA